MRISKFSVGLFLGSVAGAVATLFLTPTSGKENRELAQKKITELMDFLHNQKAKERVMEIFGDVTEDSLHLYTAAMARLEEQLEVVKKNVGQIDKQKYLSLVDEILMTLKKETQTSTDRLQKLKSFLFTQWSTFIEEGKKDVHKIMKSAETEKEIVA